MDNESISVTIAIVILVGAGILGLFITQQLPITIGGVDLSEYCRHVSTNPDKDAVQAIEDESSSTGWSCQNQPDDLSTRTHLTLNDFEKACQNTYQDTKDSTQIYGRFLDKNNLYSYQCFQKP